MNRPRLIAASIIGTVAITAILMLNRFDNSTDPASGGRQPSGTPSEISNPKSQISNLKFQIPNLKCRIANRESQVTIADPERRAAEWVLENKGTMSIAASPDWQWQGYGASDDAKPLPSEPFVITILGMANSQVKTQSDLERLTRCRYLEDFCLTGGIIDRPAIDLLTRLPRLKTLVLSSRKNLRTSALPKPGRISTLDHLSISSDMVDDRLEFVCHLPALRTLNIYGPQPPKDNTMPTNWPRA